jgi:hypothetical protein
MACRPASDFYHYGYSARLSGDEPLRFAVARDREAHGSANLGDLFSGKCEGRSVVIVPNSALPHLAVVHSASSGKRQFHSMPSAD